ncbi:MAG: ASCH domain-containing protein [Candidatus Aenigmarchaeota archaeon]|nr:ASCH domain-containing protein [Candidatus Aenigmarchaeota archaeon]
MEHLAIMRKSWKLTEKILTGQKTIESRWYKTRYTPWDRIKSGENIYFKNSGEPVQIKAEVKKIIQFSDLTREKVKMILSKYAEQDGINREDVPKFFEMFKEKKYCILIFLKMIQKIKPFEINKTGFGSMSSWITINSAHRQSQYF